MSYGVSLQFMSKGCLNRIVSTFRVEALAHTFLAASTVAQMAACIEAHDARPGQAEKIARALQAVRQLSDDEVTGALRQKTELTGNVIAPGRTEKRASG